MFLHMGDLPKGEVTRIFGTRKRNPGIRQRRKHVSAPAIHDDRIYRGYDHGLGCYIEGRTHRREVMKRLGKEECGDIASRLRTK